MADLHRPRPSAQDLARSLCLKTTRVLRRDWTVAYNGHLYQIHDPIRATHVQVEERVDGKMQITHQGRTLDSQAIAARPARVATPPRIQDARRPGTPPQDHPWRKRLLPERGQHAATVIT